jgi:hypothetical protein
MKGLFYDDGKPPPIPEGECPYDPGSPATKWWSNGWDCASLGVRREHCPYRDGIPKNVWRKGWDANPASKRIAKLAAAEESAS